MRVTHRRDGVSVKAYAGTTGVLLAMDIQPERRKGLLGFALQRRAPNDAAPEWLNGMLAFPGQDRDPGTLVPTNMGPIQRFRWSDYRVYPDTTYTYTVHPVYGTPEDLKIEAGPTVEVRTSGAEDAEHRVLFNRAAAASQAFSLKFRTFSEQLDRELAAARREHREPNIELPADVCAWLGRGLPEEITGFMARALDETWALDIVIYEYELPLIAEAVEQAHARGAKVRIVYHAKPGDEQTAVNEEHLRGLPDAIKRPRLTKAICHQKFAVLSRIEGGKHAPKAVLCGSANYTENGVYRQANVVHRIERADFAAHYLDLFEVLFRGDDQTATRTWINEHNLIPETGALGGTEPVFIGFSPRSKRRDLQALARTIAAAQRDVLFCTAFNLDDEVDAALLGVENDPILRYGLQNSRSSMTGIHADRSADFVATAMLNKGLEGFQKETTKGQRGNILVHTKLVVIDFTSNSPTVISGSHNFSSNASKANDENFLVLRGNTDLADAYGCELMRLYDHYRFRFHLKEQTANGQPAKPLGLVPDDSWTDCYFERGNLRRLDRLRFAGHDD
jgi:phosphatidylserine/phosphatidylglycerophosphate/cardiolipin synthase-like enzyme